MIERDRQPHPSASGRALFQNSTAVKAMARRLKTNEGRDLYAKRKQTPQCQANVRPRSRLRRNLSHECASDSPGDRGQGRLHRSRKGNESNCWRRPESGTIRRRGASAGARGRGRWRLLDFGATGVSEVLWGRGAVCVSVARQELSAELVLDVDCVSGPDLIAEVVDQFEHGEGGFGGPVVWDLEQDQPEGVAGRGCHELGALR